MKLKTAIDRAEYQKSLDRLQGILEHLAGRPARAARATSAECLSRAPSAALPGRSCSPWA